MLKILSASQIKELDKFTIENEPVKSIDLMERAAHACFTWIKERYATSRSFKIFCGLGNNGGDGLAIARMLVQAGYNVQPYIVRYSEKTSDDFKVNEARLMQIDLSLTRNINDLSDIHAISSNDIVIDALFGTGLAKPVEGLEGKVIDLINKSHATIISIDMPGGMFADQCSHEGKNKIIKATHSLTFELKKLCFYLPENAEYFGEVIVLPIGLNKSFIEKANTDFFEIEKADVQKIIKARKPFSHKGDYGHALIVSGSYGKTGAAVLAAKGCMRAGAGLLTVHIPRIGYYVLQIAVPEAMVQGDEDREVITNVYDAEKYDAIGIGPGIGTHESTQKALINLIQNYRKPVVFDADAINILGENKTWLPFVTPGSIFTPHPKEFERLAGKSSDHFERLKLLKDFSVKNNSCVILKGHYSAIMTPEGKCYFNPTGNAGMATGGSGDVLTGIVTSLMAQGYSSKDSCIAGTFIHGLAGNIAATKKSQQSLIASDIAETLPAAFSELIRT